MMLQLIPQIPVRTSKGNGQAIMVIDYSEEYDLFWVVFLDESGECWTLNNKEIRAFPNQTMGRAATGSFDGGRGKKPRKKATRK